MEHIYYCIVFYVYGIKIFLSQILGLVFFAFFIILNYRAMFSNHQKNVKLGCEAAQGNFHPVCLLLVSAHPSQLVK